MIEGCGAGVRVGVLLARVLHYGGCELVWVVSVSLIGSRVSAQRKSYWLGKRLMRIRDGGWQVFIYCVGVGSLPVWTMRANFRRLVVRAGCVG